jgi:rubrerythrin
MTCNVEAPIDVEMAMVDMQQLKKLLLQSLEHERAGVDVYETAIRCAVSEDLRYQWSQYLEQTRTHVELVEDVLRKLEIDPEQSSPGRAIVRQLGLALVDAMESAKAADDATAAQLVACECVVLAETKDHMHWELLTKCAQRLLGAQKQALEEACEIVEEQEDEHLYHSRGYCRELWLDSLGLPAMLPPPEEMQHVRSAISAAQAQQQSERNR